MKDMLRHLRKFDLSEEVVMGRSLRSARDSWRAVRAEVGLAGAPRLTTEPTGSAKAEHGLGVERVAVWMLYLAPADSSGSWQTCRYASAGCRSACLNLSGQAGLESTVRPEHAHILRARRARTELLGRDPVAFFRILAEEWGRIPASVWAQKGFALGVRANGTSDLPFETVVPWLFERALADGVTPYDYTAYPSHKRDRATSLVYIVDSVKETHSDRAIAAMARPVVVLDIPRGGAIPAVWRGRPTVDADLSDGRWLDREGTVRVLRYKHVSSCTKADALASGFCKSVA